ncbi:MAG: hypothetical protein M3400_00695 [Actinomycetota bacterium]|nr:hypothetical protein [Actinomycetota bacterium]
MIVVCQDAVRDRDVAAFTALVHEDIEIGGPKGSSNGVDLMTTWVRNSTVDAALDAAGFRATPAS